MKVDMSPKAVKSRLKLVSELWRLSLALGRAKKETDARRKISLKLENEMLKIERRLTSDGGDKKG